jgi:hypothetical protein
MALSFPRSVTAQVIINGQLIQGQALAELEAIVGSPVPAGRYWLNLNTGDWGYEGNPQIQGNILNSSGGGGNSYYSPGGAGGYGGYVRDPQTGCSYYDLGGYSVNTCDSSW